MARGNFLLGYATGSVGDVTFSRINGQQTARARNRNPKNPKTKSQQSQRALFTGAVKFFTAGNQALFKFAYEDKRERESDYNAFMRHNAKTAPMLTKGMAANGVAVPAHYLISQGSLTEVYVVIDDLIDTSLDLRFPSYPNASVGYANTVGGLSQYLINDVGGWDEGDILTIYAVQWETPAETVQGLREGLLATNIGSQTWVTRQIVLSASSNVSLSTLGLGLDAQQDDVVVLSANDSRFMSPTAETNICLGAALIHSRNTASGLKVSTQRMVLSSANDDLYAALTSDAYKSAVLLDWGYNADAILQGNLN